MRIASLNHFFHHRGTRKTSTRSCITKNKVEHIAAIQGGVPRSHHSSPVVNEGNASISQSMAISTKVVACTVLNIPTDHRHGGQRRKLNSGVELQNATSHIQLHICAFFLLTLRTIWPKPDAEGSSRLACGQRSHTMIASFRRVAIFFSLNSFLGSP